MMGQDVIQPWDGEPSKAVRLATGKLAEEANELAGICARIAIQGLAGIDPKSGKSNADALAEEMSDVLAGMNFVNEHTSITANHDRMEKKLSGYRLWFAMIGIK